MTGIQEILTLVLLFVCIIFLPRLFKGTGKAAGRHRKNFSFSGKMRLAIVLSLIFPLVMSLPLPPSQPENRFLFFLGGILPVLICWAGAWILQGFRKK